MAIKEELRSYLEKKEFKTLLEELKKKYISYGKVVGVISITPTTIETSSALSGFLSKNIIVNQENKIKIKDINNALENSRFEGLTVDDIITIFYPNILTNKEIKQNKEDYINKCINEYINEYNNKLFISLLDNPSAYKKIIFLINHNKILLDNIFKAINILPNEPIYLSIFSSLVTSNPHYFDLDTPNSNTFLEFLCFINNTPYINKRREKIKLLEQYNILIDDLSNQVITYNLYGNKLLDIFLEYDTPCTLNLSNINKLDKIKAKNNKVLLVENPSFLNKILGKKIDYSVIVTSGNLNLSVHKVLDKLDNATIYYNGDFDPEGLLIAYNLKKKYANINLIGYNEKYYYNGLSTEPISSKRLNILNKINESNLIEIKNLLLKESKPSYQENNYDYLINDIKKMS